MKTLFSLIICTLLTSCASNHAQMDVNDTSPYSSQQSPAALEASKMVSPAIGY